MPSNEQIDLFDEKGALESIQKDAETLAKQFQVLTKLKPSDPTALEQLQKALAELPTGEAHAKAVEELRQRAETTVLEARKSRAEQFGRHEVAFLNELRRQGIPTRESGNSAWRVGPLEIVMRREASQAQARYNLEVLVPWRPITSTADLLTLRAAALKILEGEVIEADMLPGLLWEAYEYLSRESSTAATTVPRIQLKDMYREFRIVLARQELRAGKHDRKIKRTEFPIWAFLYNLDLYRRMLPGLDTTRRLSLETGSQQDHKRGLAMILNGLSATDDYKSYCYAYAAAPPTS